MAPFVSSALLWYAAANGQHVSGLSRIDLYTLEAMKNVPFLRGRVHGLECVEFNPNGGNTSIDTSKARNVDQQQSLSSIHSDMDTIGIMQGNR